jgi:hypothetical protein
MIPHCFRLETKWIPLALDFALERAGSSMPAVMAMMSMTTNSSIKVKPLL